VTPGTGNYAYAEYAALDVDDTSSFGPETITLTTLTDGTYKYLIHDYSNGGSLGSDYLRNSQAVIRVYYGDTMREFNVPTGGGPSTVWHVFDIVVVNGVGTLVPINEMENNGTYAGNVGLDGYSYGGGGSTGGGDYNVAAVFSIAAVFDGEYTDEKTK
jgi:hypothetical protein